MAATGQYTYPRVCQCGGYEHDHPTATCDTFRFKANRIVWVEGDDGRSPANEYVGGGLRGPNTGD